jgi:hypothetical protein
MINGEGFWTDMFYLVVLLYAIWLIVFKLIPWVYDALSN